MQNIRMIAKYYTRVTLARMAELLGWQEEADKTEEFLAQLVVDGTIPDAKIDRLSGIVSFKVPFSLLPFLPPRLGNGE